MRRDKNCLRLTLRPALCSMRPLIEHPQQQGLQILPFGMEDIHRVIGRLAGLGEDLYVAPRFLRRGEDDFAE